MYAIQACAVWNTETGRNWHVNQVYISGTEKF